MITGEQIRAARALLRWSVRELVDAADGGVSEATVRRLEQVRGEPRAQIQTILAITRAFERSGVTFQNTPAVIGVTLARRR